MIITETFLRQTAEERRIYSFSENRILMENKILFQKKDNTYDIFLSHSYLDKELVLTLIELLNEEKFSVYVDWIEDAQLDRSTVNAVTANLLKKRMKSSKGLAYLTTENVARSQWCPWELGYFDGLKNEKCCILPILKYDTSIFNGREYLGLYPYIDYTASTGNSKKEFWVTDSKNPKKYCRLSEWLRGSNLTLHP